ncbi:MAG TPA: hypothetical protein PKI61_04015 [bacterium]|nr:hypothetical protein [bacterium]HPT29827.1 hypothetical protein [bacterium]
MPKEMMSLDDLKKPVDNPREVRAAERNTYLSAWKKIFSPITAADISQEESQQDSILEEAEAINRAADKLVQEKKAANYTEAVDVLVQTKFKNKNSLEIMAEEKARAAALKVSDLMSSNQFDKIEGYSWPAGVFRKESPVEKKHEEARDKEFGSNQYGNSTSWKMDISWPADDLFHQYKDEIVKQKYLELKRLKDQKLLNEFNAVFSNYVKNLKAKGIISE